MRKVIAIDFDGCLCENAWLEIGAPRLDVIGAAIREQANGAALILWTCRVRELLEAAIDWCLSYGLEFNAVNENLPERLEYYGSESRKISADEYWDDLAVHMPLPPNDPLTLEELREMGGEPYWHVGLQDDSPPPHWTILDPFFAKHIDDYGYGVRWLAYRRKPEDGIVRLDNVCTATGGPCCQCKPGPCDSRQPEEG